MRLRLLLILLLAGGILAALSVVLWRGAATARTITAVVSEAPQLREGALVTYLGVTVGTVRHMDLSSGRVGLTLAIERPDVVLRQGDSVRVRTLGLLGDKVVDIVASGRGAALGAHDSLFGRDDATVRVDARWVQRMFDSAWRQASPSSDSLRGAKPRTSRP